MLLWLLLFVSVVSCVPVVPETDSSNNNTNLIQVYVVAHSHDDPGWLRTIDEYYEYEVEYIISGVLAELEKNPKRKFIQVEMSYLRLWWNDQDEETKDLFRKHVRNGQLKLVLGGESMPDEADSDYEALINNLASGHEFIATNFGEEAVPTISWHIDPFGHSSSTAMVYAKSGFKAMVINRVDYRVKEQMKADQTLEFFWQPGPNISIFTHVLDSHYCTPDGFDWEHGVTQELPQGDGPPPVITKQTSPVGTMNVHAIATNFTRMIVQRRQWYRTPHVLIPFGCDFNFQNARMKYFNMDKLMEYINERPQVYGLHIEYSTVDDYIDALERSTPSSTFPVVHSDTDYFPYADGPVPWIPAQAQERNQGYWSGFYSSRPQQKGQGRRVETLYHAAEAFDAANTLSLPSSSSSSSSSQQQQKQSNDRLELVRQESSTFQHHDAVTGTERDHVMVDYGKRLSISADSASTVLVESVMNLLNVSSVSSSSASSSSESESCRYVGVSNPSGWVQSGLMSLALMTPDVQVHTLDGQPVQYQVSPAWKGGDMFDGGVRSSAPYTLYFAAENVPPLATIAYKLTYQANNSVSLSQPITEGEWIALAPEVEIRMFNSRLEVKNQVGIANTVEVLYYNASINASQPSGAYIFRPTAADALAYCRPGEMNVSLVAGSLVNDIRLECFDPPFDLNLRLTNPNPGAMQVSHSIGVVPLGKEVIIRYASSINSGNEFYSDTNALRLMKRTRTGPSGRHGDAADAGVVVAANTYPVNSGLLVEDRVANKAMGVLVGRPVGATSMDSGVVDVLVHRRLRADDYRGVREPLNDTTVANGQHLIVLGDIDEVHRLHRRFDALIRHPLEIVPLPSDVQPNLQISPAIVAQALPENIQLLTLAVRDGHHHHQQQQHHKHRHHDNNDNNNNNNHNNQHEISVVLRLHHMYQEQEHSQLSQPVTLNLQDWFGESSPWKIQDVKEVDHDLATRSERPSDIQVTLQPLEIRSFIINLKKK